MRVSQKWQTLLLPLMVGIGTGSALALVWSPLIDEWPWQSPSDERRDPMHSHSDITTFVGSLEGAAINSEYVASFPISDSEPGKPTSLAQGDRHPASPCMQQHILLTADTPAAASVHPSRTDQAQRATRDVQACLTQAGSQLAGLSDDAPYRDVLALLLIVDQLDTQHIRPLILSAREAMNRSGTVGSPEQHVVLRALLQRWSTRDNAAVIEFAMELSLLGDSWSDTVLSDTAFSVSTEHRPIDALNAIASLPDSPEKSVQLLSTLNQLAQTNPAGALSWLDHHDPGSTDNSHQVGILYIWLEQDPAAALPHIEALQNSQTKSYLLAEYAQSLADTDPLLALDWIEQLPNLQARHIARQEVMDQWAVTDSSSVLEYLNSNLSEAEQVRLIRRSGHSIANGLLQQYPMNPMGALTHLPDRMKSLLQPMVFESWFQNHPAGAMAWHKTTASVSDSILEGVLPFLPYNDRELALALYPELTEQEQHRLIPAIVEVLAMDNPVQAQEWIDTITMPSSLVLAEATLIRTLMATEPQQASQMALAYHHDDRTDLIIEVAHSLWYMAPDLAEPFIASTQLSAADQELIRAQWLLNGYPHH